MSTPSSEQQSKQLQFQELLLERTKALAAAAAQQSEKTNSIDGKFTSAYKFYCTFHLDKFRPPTY